MPTSDKSDSSDRSDPSDRSTEIPRLLPKHGGYDTLRSFQVSLAVYDATALFCNRFIDLRSRTHDQMVQAARSGVRNICEGSLASGTSKKTELKLTNVARASLGELMGDYEDFLRHRGLRVWNKDDPEALAVRRRYKCPASDGSDRSDQSDRSEANDPFGIRTASPEAAANTLLCLINQASYLLRRQLERLERDFLVQGGFTERLYSVRSQVREGAPRPPTPICPTCGQPMRLRTARQGAHTGQPFWGCTAFPDCRGTRPAEMAGLA